MNPYELLFNLYRFYSLNLKKQKPFPYPSICTGSLLMGGAGKTPLSLEIVHLLKDKYRVAVLIRGYRRKKKQNLAVKEIDIPVEEIGDEAKLYLKHFNGNVPVGVGKRREKLADKIARNQKIDIFVLDDAYQYLRYTHYLSFVVIPENSLRKKQKLFPFGKLRENWDGLKRCDAVIINYKFRSSTEGNIPNFLKRYTIFSMRYRISHFEDFNGNTIDTECVSSDNSIAFAGIGDIESFKTALHPFKILDIISFPDHHNYSSRELREIYEYANKYRCNWIITTEKDRMRIKEPAPNLIYPVLRVEFCRDFYPFFDEKISCLVSSVRRQRG